MPAIRPSPAAALLGLLGVIAAGPAHAYCRTSSTSSPTHEGHVCTPPQDDDSGLPLYWGMPRVTYSLQQDASVDIPFETAQSTLRAAFDAWMGADCDGEPPRIEVVEAEATVCAQQEYSSDRGNANIIFFVDQGWDDDPSRLAVTIVTFDTKTGEIYDADMAVNTALWAFTTGGSGGDPDLLSVFTHETGHFLGLAHTPAAEATMQAVYSSPAEDDLRTLAEDDRAGICAIYPPGEIEGPCDATPRHGFSTLCEADQSGPVPDEPPTEGRCCCPSGEECLDGLCVPGCGCTTVPVSESPWPAAWPLVVAAAALSRRRRLPPFSRGGIRGTARTWR